MQVKTTPTCFIEKWEGFNNDQKTVATIEDTAKAMIQTLREKQTFKCREGSQDGAYYFCSHTLINYRMNESELNKVINETNKLLVNLKYPSIKQSIEKNSGETESMDFHIRTFTYDFTYTDHFQLITNSAYECLKELDQIEFTYDYKESCYRLDNPSLYAVYKIVLKDHLLCAISHIKNLAQANGLEVKETSTPFKGDYPDNGYDSYILSKAKL